MRVIFTCPKDSRSQGRDGLGATAGVLEDPAMGQKWEDGWEHSQEQGWR